MADNDLIDLRLEAKFLQPALKLVMLVRNSEATHYRINEKYGMVLYDKRFCDHGEKHVPPLISIPEWQKPWTLAKEWLETAKPDPQFLDEMERDADHDGDNSVGFRMFNEVWAMVDGDHHAFIAIKPVYLWHGK